MDMLSATDLLTITSKPNVKDLSLQTIQEFYEEYLCGRLFIFELDDSVRSTVRLRFKERDLCHLLGIQYIVKRLKNKYDYAGEKGYKKLEDGTVTFEFLKRTNNAWFKSKRNRMLYFPFVYQIVNNPTAIIFSSGGLSTSLVADIIFYNKVNNIYLHLALDKDPDSDYYYPKSFFDRNKDDFIKNRTHLLVKSVTIKTDT